MAWDREGSQERSRGARRLTTELRLRHWRGSGVHRRGSAWDAGNSAVVCVLGARIGVVTRRRRNYRNVSRNRKYKVIRRPMIDEPVHLEEYRAQWATLFLDERRRLIRVLKIGSDAVEHIGSTAVPGLAAKPVIDIMIGSERYPPRETWTQGLIGLGYEPLGEAGVPGRVYLRLRTAPYRNIHIVARGGEHWVRNLALRDHLRRAPDAVRRYEVAKRAALGEGSSSLLAYSAAKSAVIQELIAEALTS